MEMKGRGKVRRDGRRDATHLRAGFLAHVSASKGGKGLDFFQGLCFPVSGKAVKASGGVCHPKRIK